jgi:hypothetical protein
MLLANDSDPDGDALVVTSVSETGTAGGTVAATSATTWRYTPPAGFTGTDTVAYTVDDGRGGTASAILEVTVADAAGGLVAAFGFDEGSGTSAVDVSGNGNDGTVSGAGRVAGKFGGALSFDGVDDIVVVPDAAALDLTSGMTIEAWVRPTQASGWRTVALKETAGGLAYGLYAHDSAVGPGAYVNVGALDENATVPTALTLGAWTHVAATYDGAALKVYVNGALAATHALSGSLVQSGRPLGIGGNRVWGEYFAGAIDEVRIYDRALSAAQIDLDSRTALPLPAPPANAAPVAQTDRVTTAPNTAVTVTAATLLANDTDANGDALSVTSVASSSVAGGGVSPAGTAAWTYTPPAGFTGSDSFTYAIADGRGGTAQGTVSVTVTAPSTGLVGAWGFNEASGTTTADASGNGRTGTIREAVRTAGRSGGALRFDGVNDWVTVADHATLDLTTGMTIEAWVRPAAMSGWETVVTKERSGGYAYALYAQDGAPLAGGAAVPSGNVRVGTADRTLRGTTQVPTGQWTHLATTYDGAVQRLFVNGIEVSSRTQTGTIAVTAGALRIGGNAAWADEFFEGDIDDVRIYNRALSPAEVQADMDTPVP